MKPHNHLPDEFHHHKEEKEPIKFWKIIGALFLIIILLAMIIPHYAVKLDPEPTQIPEVREVIRDDIPINNISHSIDKIEDFRRFLTPNDPIIKQAANKIVSRGCDSNKACQAKAIYYFLRDKFTYVSDPSYEYIAGAKETLFTESGDCDDMSVLAANLYRAIGIPTRFVFIPGHVYLQIKVDDALKKYKQKDGWINVDLTCTNCEFSKVPYSTIEEEKKIVE